MLQPSPPLPVRCGRVRTAHRRPSRVCRPWSVSSRRAVTQLSALLPNNSLRPSHQRTRGRGRANPSLDDGSANFGFSEAAQRALRDKRSAAAALLAAFACAEPAGDLSGEEPWFTPPGSPVPDFDMHAFASPRTLPSVAAPYAEALGLEAIARMDAACAHVPTVPRTQFAANPCPWSWQALNSRPSDGTTCSSCVQTPTPGGHAFQCDQCGA